MSLINFVPFAFDDFGAYKPMRLFDRDQFASLSSGYEEDEKEIRFSIDVPGVKAADLEVTVKDGQLHVSGSRSTKLKDGNTTKRARFSRSFSLEEDSVDVSKMKANLSDGVLVVTVPKKPRSEPIKIGITTNLPEEKIEIGKETAKSIEAEKSKDE